MTFHNANWDFRIMRELVKSWSVHLLPSNTEGSVLKIILCCFIQRTMEKSTWHKYHCFCWMECHFGANWPKHINLMRIYFNLLRPNSKIDFLSVYATNYFYLQERLFHDHRSNKNYYHLLKHFLYSYWQNTQTRFQVLHTYNNLHIFFVSIKHTHCSHYWLCVHNTVDLLYF